MNQHKSFVLERCQAIPGWMDFDGLNYLYDFASCLAPGSRWLEIGMFFGRSFTCVLQAIHPVSMVYGVDDLRGVRDGDRFDEIRSELLANVKKTGRRNYFLAFEESTRWATGFPDGFFDVVFVDGSHDYKSVKADFEAWSRKVKRQGILCGHDFSEPGVKLAISQSFSNCEIAPGDIWSVRL